MSKVLDAAGTRERPLTSPIRFGDPQWWLRSGAALAFAVVFDIGLIRRHFDRQEARRHG